MLLLIMLTQGGRTNDSIMKNNDDLNLPIKLIRFEGDICEPIHKHWHNSLEIVLPICGAEYGWVDGK